MEQMRGWHLIQNQYFCTSPSANCFAERLEFFNDGYKDKRSKLAQRSICSHHMVVESNCLPSWSVKAIPGEGPFFVVSTGRRMDFY